MTTKTPGQSAYEKWRERLGEVAVQVCEVPRWSGCLPGTRHDWEVIANAAIASHHAMVDELNRTEGGTG